MTETKSALVISAHAADFVWRCGGAIALHQKLGREVTVACLSYGERGESARLWKENKSLDEVKSIRRTEAENAAKALSVHDIQFFDLGDYPLELDRDAKFKLVDLIRAVQPQFMLSHSHFDPYNTDHMYTTSIAMECRMIAQAWGHNPGEKVLGAPQLYLFEPHQTEQMGWKPDTFLDITDVWDQKRAAIECMEGQHHLWLLLRLGAALYLLASALARYDRTALSPVESIVRLALAAGLMFSNPLIHGPVIVLAIGLIVLHVLRSRSAALA